jgi:hypothetical protein
VTGKTGRQPRLERLRRDEGASTVKDEQGGSSFAQAALRK